MAFFKKPPRAPVGGRELDVRLALALGWSWHEAQPGLALLCPPPEDACEGFFYDEHGDGYQFVPRWSTDWRAAGMLLAAWTQRYTVELVMIVPQLGEWRCDVAGIIVNGELLERARGIASTGPHTITWAICQAAEARNAAMAASLSDTAVTRDV